MLPSDLTDEQWLLIDQYQQRFGEPARPPLNYGQHTLTAQQMLDYAKQGLQQGAPIDWGSIYAEIPDDAES